MHRLKLSILATAAAVPAAVGLFLASAAGPEEDPAPKVPACEPQPRTIRSQKRTPLPNQNEPENTPEVPETPEVPQVPEIPETPETPETPEFPGPHDGGDDPVVPEEPQPQVPDSRPTPEQPSTPAPDQPQPKQEETPVAPTADVPLPPATGTGPAVTGRSALGSIALAIGAGLAGLGSAAAAATSRRR